MAKQTEDREDLLRDGTAMTVRGRLLVGNAEVVIGFRSRGQLSLYWDQDPVFQFDESGRLRRAFVDAGRWKAQNGRLVRLLPSRPSDDQPVSRLKLLTEPVSDADQAGILQRLAEALQQIDAVLEPVESGERGIELQTVGASTADFARRVRRWIQAWKGTQGLAGDPSA